MNKTDQPDNLLDFAATQEAKSTEEPRGELNGGTSIQARFEAFHQKHPDVYRGLVRLARQGKAAGASKLGLRQLWEVLRWEWTLEGLPDEGETYKLNDHYCSRYARRIMATEPDLAGIFEVRELRTR